MFVKLTTSGTVDKYPYTIGHLRRDNPNTSFPKKISDESLAQLNVFPVVDEQPPAFDPETHFVEFGPVPELVGEQWTMRAHVRELSPEQIAERDFGRAAAIRAERDRLLSETDWLVVKAAETSSPIPVEWVDYRQALRDITAQETFPRSVVWPTEPN